MAARRNVSDRYKMRVNKLYGETLKLRHAVGGDAVKVLTYATEQQLYTRTPLKVTKTMLNSIGYRLVPEGIEVGYNFNKQAPKARYAYNRLNMTGISKVGGHVLDMDPGKLVYGIMLPRIEKMYGAAQKRIMDG